jgi:hypothetical protein
MQGQTAFSRFFRMRREPLAASLWYASRASDGPVV